MHKPRSSFSRWQRHVYIAVPWHSSTHSGEGGQAVQLTACHIQQKPAQQVITWISQSLTHATLPPNTSREPKLTQAKHKAWPLPTSSSLFPPICFPLPCYRADNPRTARFSCAMHVMWQGNRSLQDAGLKEALSCSLAQPCKHHLNANRAALLSHRAWGCLANTSGTVSENRRENDTGQKKKPVREIK